MQETDPLRAHEVFLEVVDLPATERRRLLAECCDGDTALRREVEALLESEDAMPQSFLGGLAAGGLASGALDLSPGATLASYEIVGLLGEGGMGAVYEALQSSPARRVALKVIRPDRMSKETRRRLQQEAEVLGALQHPGIAHIHEAGTAGVALDSGGTVELPFLAMELVRGEPLLDYAEAAALSVRERLELVARTCDAVHHAHQRGVIHRDLKSENVLVCAPSDATPKEGGQPKILDFGIARVVGDEHRSTLTRVGQIIGTLGAMSPEQISGEGGLDVRTDVYALGALLYELLAGRPPVQIAYCTFPEAVRRVQRENPPSLAQFTPELRGDISVIASMALHKEKDRRYQSAAALAEDLRRHLTGEAVRARADSTWYVVGRVLRRHFVAALTAVVFIVLGLAFVVVSSIQSDRNRRLAEAESGARMRAEQQLAISNIERGRLFGENHNGLGAELLWREYLRDPGSPHAYWALWEFYSHNSCITTKVAHGDRARQAEVSPDGTWFATGDFAGVIVLWDAGGRETGRITVPGTPVRAMSPSPDGKSLAASYLDGTVRLWDVGTGNPLWVAQVFSSDARNQAAGARSLGFDPTGELLVTTGANHDLHVLTSRNGDELRTLEHPGPVWSVAFSADGKRLASMGSPEVRVWDLPSFEPVATLPGHAGTTFAGALSQTGDRLFTGGGDKKIIEWDIETGDVLRGIQPGNGWIRLLTWSADERALFANGLYRADLLTLPGLEVASSVPYFTNATAGFAAFPDDSQVVTTEDRGTVRVWETATYPGRKAYGGHTGTARAALSPDGALLATGDESGRVRLWRTTSGELESTLGRELGPVRSLSFHPQGPQVGVAGPSGVLRVLDTQTGEIVWEFTGCVGQANRGFAFSPVGDRIAAAGTDQAFHVWGLDDGEERFELPVAPFEAVSINFSPDGQRIATVSRKQPTTATEPWSHRIDVWDRSGRRLATESSGPPWWSAGFSPDGSQIVSGTWDWGIGLWNWETGELSMLEGHEGTVWDAQYLPEHPGLVASSSADGTVRLWSVELARNVLTLEGFEYADVVSLGTSADGTLLTTAGEGSDALVWDLTHFERHIAGNLDVQLENLGDELGDGVPRDELEAWAREVLRRPWPRFAR